MSTKTPIPSRLRTLFESTLHGVVPDEDDAPEGQVFVGALGKHPAWDDFFWIGLDTDRLADVFTVLYNECLNRNIESGVWGDPSSDITVLSDPANLSAILLDGRWITDRVG